MQATASVAASARPADRRILVAALILGAVAAGLVVAYLRSVESRSSTPIPLASVVVAREDIAAGKKITDSMIEVRALPETAVIGGALTSKELAVAQIVRYPVAKGEQLNAGRLVDAPKTQALSFQIPSGLRGFTIPVTVTKSPAALLAPGDFVDVLGSFEFKSLWIVAPPDLARRADDARIPLTLIQNVQVLAVQRQTVENGVPYDASVRGTPPKEANITYVTLAVTPEDAQLLTMAVDRAKLLTVSLRGFGDEQTKELSPGWEWVPANPPPTRAQSSP